ncbi:MAG: tyrosine-type recombinase/integrase [Ignavibacteriaceae bacterium]
MMLFKRDGYFHVEYFDEKLQRLRRRSLKVKNKNDALKKLTDFKESLLHDQKSPSLLFSKFHDDYIKFVKETGSKKYLSSVELSLRKLKSYLNKDLLLSELNRVMMEKFLLSVFSNSKYAAHLYCRTLKAAMNKAITWDYLQNNPFKGIKLPKIPVKHPAFISENELDTIIENVKEKDIKDIITIAFFTGMRVSEIINLKWDAINFTSGIITVQNNESFTTKNKHERIIPIHSKVNSLLMNRNLIASKDYIFSKNGILYHQELISKVFKRAVRKIGLSEDLHFHSLRHSFASNLVKKGISLYVVKELLGHESITTTQIYSHLQKESLVNAISLL